MLRFRRYKRCLDFNSFMKGIDRASCEIVEPKEGLWRMKIEDVINKLMRAEYARVKSNMSHEELLDFVNKILSGQIAAEDFKRDVPETKEIIEVAKIIKAFSQFIKEDLVYL